jgi:hypothetical protein
MLCTKVTSCWESPQEFTWRSRITERLWTFRSYVLIYFPFSVAIRPWKQVFLLPYNHSCLPCRNPLHEIKWNLIAWEQNFLCEGLRGHSVHTKDSYLLVSNTLQV